MNPEDKLEEPNQSNWKLPVGIVVLLIVVAGGLAWYQNHKSPKIITKVGAVIPLTGASSLWGTGVKDGMDLALSEINTNNKENFKVIYEDTQSKNDIAVTAAQKLINVDMVNVLYEFGDSYVYCKQGLMKYYSEQDIAVTETLANADFRTLLLKLKQDNTDAVVLNTNEPHAINLFDQMKELDIKFNSIFCEESTCYTSAVQEKSGFVENLINYDPYFTDDFLKKLSDKLGTNDIVRITPIAYGYYDTIRLYEASKSCKNLDKSCYISAISNVGDLGVFKDAPTRDRGYYPILKFKKVGANGTQLEINL